ncbi:Rqc2 family fibronectin-binding protein [Thermohalobacter berrensis]|uniref:Rqc2 homolog RqcH n=1 Tax=Thermohalobacter berrensis TaxID=99594 RepID=A0A419TA57_9FIRM|nr:NFACT RNA binding domain-containing protein [Thermohalobacter berrensis]RKD34353.1 hypothetical protein BET03_00530 [Thermohalobacter berrensis]
MALDGIVINSLVNEFKSKMLNGKIDKVYQPEREEIVINIRKKGQKLKLFISAASNNPRIHLTELTKSNPLNPPMFCMLLRKHLQGGKIIDIKQPSFERIIKIEVENLDELGEISVKEIVIEIMGRHSNIILVDKKSGKIIDAIKRITPDISSVRQVLPGLKYSYPPSQNKKNPLKIDKNIFFKELDSANDGTVIYKFLYRSFTGISPLVGREICYKAGIDESKQLALLNNEEKEKLYQEFNKVISDVKNNFYNPCVIFDEENQKLIAFSAIDIKQYNNFKKEYIHSISKVLEKFYYTRDKLDRLKQKSIELKKLVNTKLDRSLKKLAKQKEELLNAEKREKYKIYGDLIMANLYHINKGDSNVEVQNFYSEKGEKIKINLDPRLTPAENAQKYYKRYNKLKNAHVEVSKQITNTKDEIDYLENILVSIENCSDPSEIDEIREELIKEGYIKSKLRNRKKKKEAPSNPYHFISSDGYDIYVGKNNKQNDYLTLKFANKEDIWLHTKEIPGSHVIVKSKGEEVPENTLKEAALLAAFYSKGKMSSNVPVDYTERKNVRKPNGAKPGMVIYDNNNTIYITPKKTEVNKIKKVED